MSNSICAKPPMGALGPFGISWPLLGSLQFQQFTCSLFLLVPSLTCLGWVGHIPLRALSPPHPSSAPLFCYCLATVWGLKQSNGVGGSQAVCSGLCGGQGLGKGAMLGDTVGLPQRWP